MLNEGMFICGAGDSFRGVRGISAFGCIAASFGFATPVADIFCSCFDAYVLSSDMGSFPGCFTELEFCNSGRTGDSLILFLLSISTAIVCDDPALLAAFRAGFLVGFVLALGAGFDVAGVASSSLEGTSKTLAITDGAEGGDIEGGVRVMLFSFFTSPGTILGDLDREGSLCLLRGTSDGDPSLCSGIRLRPALPYVAILLRGTIMSSKAAILGYDKDPQPGKSTSSCVSAAELGQLEMKWKERIFKHSRKLQPPLRSLDDFVTRVICS